MQCDCCEKWYHVVCVGISAQEAGTLDTYMCPYCKPGSITVKKEPITDSTNCSGKIASPSDTLVMEECISNDLKSIPTKTDETEKNECGNRSNISETLAHEFPFDEKVNDLTALSKENNLITNSGDKESSMKS